MPVAALSLGMTACLKSNAPNLDPSGSNNVIEFGNTIRPTSYTSIYPEYDNNNLNVLNDTTGFNILVDYAGAEYTAPRDITVTIAADDNLVSTYNTNTNSSFTTVDPSYYSFPTTITIPKGQHQAYGHVSINHATSVLGFSGTFAIGLTIKSASFGTISSNYNNAIYEFTLANYWGGSYLTTGYLFHVTASSSRSINATYPINTVDGATCKFPVGDLSSSNYYFTATPPTQGTSGAMSNYTATGATPTGIYSGFMDADDPGGVMSTQSPKPGSSPWLQSTYNNTYDDAAKTFYLHYGYAPTSQAGVTGESQYSRQVYVKMVKQ